MGGRSGWGDSPAVLVVDLTRQFSDDRWPLGRSDTGDACVDATTRLLATTRPIDIPTVFIRGRIQRDRLSISSGRSNRDANPFDPGEGNELRPEIAPLDGEVVIRKPRRSAFFGTMLDSLLRERGVDTVIVTGMVTSGCVRATVVDAFQRDFHVVVPEECVADRAPAPHRLSLFDIDMKYGDVAPLTSVVDSVQDRFKSPSN